MSDAANPSRTQPQSGSHNGTLAHLGAVWHRWLAALGRWWDRIELGFSPVIYPIIILAPAWILLDVMPQLELDQLPFTLSLTLTLTESDAAENGGGDIDMTLPDHRTPSSSTSIIRLLLHLAFIILPGVTLLSLMMVRSVSPGYLQDLAMIKRRERRQKKDRLNKRAAEEQRKETEKLQHEDATLHSPRHQPFGTSQRDNDMAVTVPCQNGITSNGMAVSVNHCNPSNGVAAEAASAQVQFVSVQPLSCENDASPNDSAAAPVVPLVSPSPTNTTTSASASATHPDAPVARHSTPTYCCKCDARRPPRSGHCVLCHTCVYRFDHHCGFLGTCVGLGNYKWFVLFLASAASAILLATGVSAIWTAQVSKEAIRTFWMQHQQKNDDLLSSDSNNTNDNEDVVVVEDVWWYWLWIVWEMIWWFCSSIQFDGRPFLAVSTLIFFLSLVPLPLVFCVWHMDLILHGVTMRERLGRQAIRGRCPKNRRQCRRWVRGVRRDVMHCGDGQPDMGQTMPIDDGDSGEDEMDQWIQVSGAVVDLDDSPFPHSSHLTHTHHRVEWRDDRRHPNDCNTRPFKLQSWVDHHDEPDEDDDDGDEDLELELVLDGDEDDET